MFKKLISAGILAVAAFSASANTTIEVPDGGSSGVQTFTFTFGSDFDGDITFGVSNEGGTGRLGRTRARGLGNTPFQ